jgi:hypothetical protein
MEISSILQAGSFLTTTLGQMIHRGQPAPAAEDASSDEAPTGDRVPAGWSALHEIVARYDVTRISPREFSDMIQQLFEADALSFDQYQGLTRVRLDLDAEGIAPDQRVNLLDFYSRKLAELEGRQTSARLFGGEAASETRRHLAWLEKIALVQSDADLGLDASA